MAVRPVIVYPSSGGLISSKKQTLEAAAMRLFYVVMDAEIVEAINDKQQALDDALKEQLMQLMLAAVVDKPMALAEISGQSETVCLAAVNRQTTYVAAYKLKKSSILRYIRQTTCVAAHLQSFYKIGAIICQTTCVAAH